MSQTAVSRWVRARNVPAVFVVCVLLAGGCTSLQDWLSNGLKVGPNFADPPAPIASQWIDTDLRIDPRPMTVDDWWSVFNDPTLDTLIATAYQQNLDLKTAVMRVLQGQAQRNISAGNLFPQSQSAIGDYLHGQISKNINLFQIPAQGPFQGSASSLPNVINVWATGFNASWELDFWGRLRRGVESSDAQLASSVESYHAALVTLLADVATNYVQIRTLQQRIAYARHNVEIQKGSLRLAEARLKQGKVNELDVEQARTSLSQTESTIPPLVLSTRQANDQLCVLLGQPPQDLLGSWPESAIPTTPVELAVGIPAELLQRRPDVRRALQDAAAQCAQIGIAEADFYPQIGVSGFIGYAASDIRRLFDQESFTGLILPNFSWKILNYGRILNNVRSQDALFQQRVLQYQQAVLTAGREVEDALAGFLQYQLQTKSLAESARAAGRSVELVQAQYRAGLVDFNRVFTTQAQLVTQEDQLAVARGNIALSVIAVYRALGGGWHSFEKQPLPSIHCADTPTETGPILGPADDRKN